MTSTAALKQPATITIDRADLDAPILMVTGRAELAIRAGTVIRFGDEALTFENDTPVVLPEELVPGTDYGLHFAHGVPTVAPLVVFAPNIVAGFHFAPGGNASGRSGGDDIPAINPYSCWDAGFRPACPDPRGMTLVTLPGGRRLWVDIYLLGADHRDNGTSRLGARIADGRDTPQRPAGKGRYQRLDYAVAVEVLAYHGKSLLGAEEFFAFAYGTTERQSRGRDPEVAGSIEDGGALFVSQCGGFDVTGTLWQWGTDGDPDDPRPSLFGGSWMDGSGAGSRCADLGYWPGVSGGGISARGRSDHLNPV